MNEWDLVDGCKTSEAPGGAFRYIYETAGIYTVTLIAKNEYGADTMTRKDYIHVTELRGGIRIRRCDKNSSVP